MSTTPSPIPRRQLLRTAACGFGALALVDILHAASSPAARIPGMVSKAKRVVWDHHGDIRGNLPRLCKQTDQPIAGLLKDLKQRGLLQDTLVLWSGEFGRTPWSQDLSGTAPIDKHGREHQPKSFCTWMAGGGVKGGLTFGETDPMGYRVVNGKVHVHDLHATMLHLLGIDHTRLTWRHLGRDFRLTDVHGNVGKEILA